VPPFVTAETFCASQAGPRYSSFLRNLPTNTKVFCGDYEYVKKADLSKGYQNPKRKLGLIMYFSEIIQLQFGKKLPYILCILRFFFLTMVA